ncbi:glycosyltransferase [Paraglaciecola Antarctic GD virus 1]|nr:glycosyltransferase [Paraglaciecola Antarctic GD virus 1]
MNPTKNWVGMPEFIQIKVKAFHLIEVAILDKVLRLRFDDIESVELFSKNLPNVHIDVSVKSITLDSREQLAGAVDQKVTEFTKSLWFPAKNNPSTMNKNWISTTDVKNRYPIYVVSKGRYKNGLTTKALAYSKINHYIVVEKSELEFYEAAKNEFATILELPQSFLDDYDTFDDLGDTKSRGPGSARNFCISHSSDHKRHWVMDDNIRRFFYTNRNDQNITQCSVPFTATEDFIDRFSNVPVAGLNYEKFLKPTDAAPPYVLNTRIYSCLLIDNTSGYKWRGRYNEDTDLSLRVLKDGNCTIQMNVFLCDKITTQRMSGGNSKEFYDGEGTKPKSEMLMLMHPDVATVEWRFNRYHHHVNYKPFKANKLKLVEPDKQYSPIDDYGLKLIDINTGKVIDQNPQEEIYDIEDFMC